MFGFKKRDARGFDETGRHRNGTGYDDNGFDLHGVDRNGYDMNGFDKYGFNKNGYDKNGFDRNGFDKYGFNKNGYDKNGFDRNGFDKFGLDINGFNKNGFGKDGYNKNGYDSRGFNKDGILNNGTNKGNDKNGNRKDDYGNKVQSTSFQTTQSHGFQNEKPEENYTLSLKKSSEVSGIKSLSKYMTDKISKALTSAGFTPHLTENGYFAFRLESCKLYVYPHDIGALLVVISTKRKYTLNRDRNIGTEYGTITLEADDKLSNPPLKLTIIERNINGEFFNDVIGFMLTQIDFILEKCENGQL